MKNTIVIKESIIEACERIRKEAEQLVRDNDKKHRRGVGDETIDIEYTEVKDNDQKLLKS